MKDIPYPLLFELFLYLAFVAFAVREVISVKRLQRRRRELEAQDRDSSPQQDE